MTERTKDIIADDDYITIEEACDWYFGGHIGAGASRAVADSGRLPIVKIGARLFVTPAAVRSLGET